MHRDFRVDLRPAIEGAVITAALLLAEHIGLWELRGRLPLPVRYTLGTAAILVGFGHTCHRRGDIRPALEVTTIAAAGGGLVIAAHLARHWRYEDQKRRMDAVYRQSNALYA